MKHSEISKLAELRKLLLSMERSLGLEELSPAERDIYYAANDLAESAKSVPTTGLMSHDLTSRISRPTFFRALKSLVNKGYLAHSQNTTRGRYVVNNPGD